MLGGRVSRSRDHKDPNSQVLSAASLPALQVLGAGLPRRHFMGGAEAPASGPSTLGGGVELRCEPRPSGQSPLFSGTLTPRAERTFAGWCWARGRKLAEGLLTHGLDVREAHAHPRGLRRFIATPDPSVRAIFNLTKWLQISNGRAEVKIAVMFLGKKNR